MQQLRTSVNLFYFCLCLVPRFVWKLRADFMFLFVRLLLHFQIFFVSVSVCFILLFLYVRNSDFEPVFLLLFMSTFVTVERHIWSWTLILVSYLCFIQLTWRIRTWRIIVCLYSFNVQLTYFVDYGSSCKYVV